MLDRTHGRELAHPPPDPSRVHTFSRIDFPSPRRVLQFTWEARARRLVDFAASLQVASRARRA